MTTTAATQTDRFGVPLKGWSLAADYPHDDGFGFVVTVECDTCGEGFQTDSPDDDTTCAICLMPPAEVAALRAMIPAPIARLACAACGFPIRADDGSRCAACTRFYAELDDRRAAWKESPIAA